MIFNWLLLLSELSSAVLLLSCAIFLTGVLLGIKRVRDAEVFSKALPTMNFALVMNIALFSASFGYAMFKNNESIKSSLSVSIEGILFLFVLFVFASIIIAILDSFRIRGGRHGAIITKYIRYLCLLMAILLFGFNLFLGGFNG